MVTLKKIQEKMSRSEPRTEVRRQLNFQDDEDYEEADRKQKARYQRRVEMMIQEDEKRKAEKESGVPV